MDGDFTLGNSLVQESVEKEPPILIFREGSTDVFSVQDGAINFVSSPLNDTAALQISGIMELLPVTETPKLPQEGAGRMYVKGSKLYFLNDAGEEIDLIDQMTSESNPPVRDTDVSVKKDEHDPTVLHFSTTIAPKNPISQINIDFSLEPEPVAESKSPLGLLLSLATLAGAAYLKASSSKSAAPKPIQKKEECAKQLH